MHALRAGLSAGIVRGITGAAFLLASILMPSGASAQGAAGRLGQIAPEPDSAVTPAQYRGQHGGRGEGGGGGRGGGRGFGGGGFGIVIPIVPSIGGGGGDDDVPRKRRPPRDKVSEEQPPKKKKKVRAGGDPPVPPITLQPQRRPAGTPPAPIGLVAGDLRDREVLVTLTDTTSDTTINNLARAYRLTRQSSFASPTLGVRFARYRIPDQRDLQQVLNDLSLDLRVVAVQPIYVYLGSQGAAAAASAVPQYAAEKLRLTDAHRIARGRNVRLAIIDSGVDVAHPELKGVVAESIDVVGGKAAPDSHGTAIAGIVGAREQLVGIAPDARLVAVRSFAQTAAGRSEGTTETLIKGIDAALGKGVRLFNLSFAGPRDPSVEQIIRIAEGKGAIFIAAAGNGGPGAPAAYPAAYDTVIAVTAVDSGDKIYDRATRGDYIAFAAPGVDILAAAPKRAYGLSSGTSLAAAHVSGIVALIVERKPDFRTADIRKLLKDSARRSEGAATADLGAGIVDAASALEALR
ncbi:MAG: S8 family peptidase [Hyphomicrobiaceae bacterium]